MNEHYCPFCGSKNAEKKKIATGQLCFTVKSVLK